MRRIWLVGIVALAAACGGAGQQGAPETTVSRAAATAPLDATAAPDATAPDVHSAAADASEALAFRAPLVEGGELDGATLAGQAVVFWFWAPF